MKRVLLLAGMQCAALGALTAPAVVAVALLIGRMVGSQEAPRALALVDGAAAAAAALAVPLFGWLADRTVSRFGRRRPWLIGGALGGILMSFAMSAATTPITLALAWMGAQAAYNAVFAAVNGLVADGLAPEARMRAGGVLAAASFLGTLPGLAAAAVFADDVRTMLLIVPVLAALVIIPLALCVEDSAAPGAELEAPGEAVAGDQDAAVTRAEGPEHETGHGGPAGGAVTVLAVRERVGVLRTTLTRPFLAVLATRFLLSAELAAGLAFALYLFTLRWELTDADAVRAVAVSSLLGAGGLVAGALALVLLRRNGPRPSHVLGLSLALLTLGMLGRGFAPSAVFFIGASVVGGLAIGLGFAANKAAAFAVLPGDRAGFGLGLVAATGSLAGMVAPFAASLLLDVGEFLGTPGDPYTVMYLGLAVFPAAALLLTGARRRIARWALGAPRG